MKYAVSVTNPPPKIVILDIPRDQYNKISYTGIEEVKNGLFFSGKYESKMHTQNQPHVICFANCRPRLDGVSPERWIIKNIDTQPESSYMASLLNLALEVGQKV